MAIRDKLKGLLKDYSVEEILEAVGIEPIDALELLVEYGAIDMDDLVEAVDAHHGEAEEQG